MSYYNNRLICSMSSLVLMAASHVAVASSGHYMGVTGGAQITQNLRSNFRDSATTVSTRTKSIFKDGYNIGLVMGAKDFEYRYEIAFNYMNQHNDSLTYMGVPFPAVNGRLRQFTLMGNFYYDFDDRSPDWAPYVGVGLGIDNAKLFLNTAVATNQVQFHENVFAYQGLLGVKCHLDRNTDFLVDYRYMRTVGVQANFRDSVLTVIPGRRDDLSNHMIVMGLQYRF